MSVSNNTYTARIKLLCGSNIGRSKLKQSLSSSKLYSAIARTLIMGGGGGLYSYFHVLSDEFLLQLSN